MNIRTGLLYIFLLILFGGNLPLHGQDIQQDFSNLLSIPRKERAKDSLFLQKIEPFIAHHRQTRDTINLVKSLQAKVFYFSDIEEKTITDSLFLELKRLVASYGFTFRENFPYDEQSYFYNIIFHHLWVWVDSSGTLSLEDIQNDSIQQQFTLNFTHNSDLDSSIVYWAKLRIRGNGEKAAQHILLPYQENSFWHQVEVFLPSRQGNYYSIKGGASVPIRERITNDWRDLYPIYIEKDADFIIYFRLHGFTEANQPYNVGFRHLSGEFLTVSRPNALQRVYAFIAILTAQLLFFVLWYLMTKERSFLPYFLYIFGIIAVAVISVRFYYWFPNPLWKRELMAVSWQLFFSWLSGIGLLGFTRRFLDTRNHIPAWDKALKIFALLYTLSMCPLLVFTSIAILNWEVIEEFNQIYQASMNVYFFLFTIGLLLISIIGYISWRQGYRPARFYLIAILCLLGSVGFLGIVPIFDLYFLASYNNAMTIVQAGIVLQLCLLALGVGNKRRILELEKIAAQDRLIEEQSKVTTAFRRFVPTDFLKAIGRESVLDVELGDGVEQKVTVFFSDIRSYTALAETMKPEENFRFLNGYLGRVGPLITENEGFVNQYYGDGIMAIFMQNPITALQAAINIQKAIQDYNQIRFEKNRPSIQIGIGLHSGPLIMGIIGDSLRMEAGVVSDTVNTASRMEGLTKHFGVNILVSETAFDQLPKDHGLAFRFLGLVQVKGKTEPLRVYDFYDGDTEDLRKMKKLSQAPFTQAVRSYLAKDFVKAAHTFDEVLKIFPQDKSSQNYKEKIEMYLIEGVHDSWDGVEKFAHK